GLHRCRLRAPVARTVEDLAVGGRRREPLRWPCPGLGLPGWRDGVRDRRGPVRVGGAAWPRTVGHLRPRGTAAPWGEHVRRARVTGQPAAGWPDQRARPTAQPFREVV